MTATMRRLRTAVIVPTIILSRSTDFFQNIFKRDSPPLEVGLKKSALTRRCTHYTTATRNFPRKNTLYALNFRTIKHKDLRCLLSNLYVDFFMIAWMKNKALSALGVRIKPYTLNIRNVSNMIFYLLFIFRTSNDEILVLFFVVVLC